jgi:hypothetical protein
VTGVIPAGVRKRFPDIGKTRPDLFTTRVASAANVRARRRFEHAIVRHERHQRIDIMSIPRIGKCL